jgi:hypothetical protein
MTDNHGQFPKRSRSDLLHDFAPRRSLLQSFTPDRDILSRQDFVFDPKAGKKVKP